jgi:hypothetical protein
MMNIFDHVCSDEFVSETTIIVADTNTGNNSDALKACRATNLFRTLQKFSSKPAMMHWWPTKIRCLSIFT